MRLKLLDGCLFHLGILLGRGNNRRIAVLHQRGGKRLQYLAEEGMLECRHDDADLVAASGDQAAGGEIKPVI